MSQPTLAERELPAKRSLNRRLPQSSATTMLFQLVIQLKGGSLDDFSDMIAFETELIAELGDSADVDGHDVGPQAANIFVVTSDPQRSFQRAKALLERTRRLARATMAFRPAAGGKFATLWPENSADEFGLE